MRSAGKLPTWVGMFCACACVASAGCSTATRPSDVAFTGAGAVERAGGIQVSMELPRRNFRVGDQVPVTIRATNITDQPIQVVSEGRDLVQVQAYQDLGLGWEQFKQFPALAMPLRVPWTLPPGASRVWKLKLTVEPDWPSAQQIMLKAVINNGPPAKPGLMIEIHPKFVKPSNE